DAGLCDDVLAVSREVEFRRSALVRLRDGHAVRVIAVSHTLPFIPELYTGLCLLDKTLLEETIAALPGEHVCVWESLEERIVLHFGPSVEAATWRAGL